jgi:hypothetical protein
MEDRNDGILENPNNIESEIRGTIEFVPEVLLWTVTA